MKSGAGSILRSMCTATANVPVLHIVKSTTGPASCAHDKHATWSAHTRSGFYDPKSGIREPLDRVAGHIPGALNLPFQDSLGADDRFRPAAELQAHYQSVIGTRSPSELVCMCGSGVTACHTLLALEIAGLTGAALYVGSWSDWVSSGNRPVATD